MIIAYCRLDARQWGKARHSNLFSNIILCALQVRCRINTCQQSNKERIERQSATGAERERGKASKRVDMQRHGERNMMETLNREQNKVGYCRIRETKRNGTGGQDHRRGRASSEERESDERTSERTRNSGHSSLRRNPYS